jgi:chromosome partitioning protein
VPVWGSVPERVAIAAGPSEWLSADGIDAYREVWRRALRASRSS